jgi:tetratricopeptide (TPR) repeat protein
MSTSPETAPAQPVEVPPPPRAEWRGGEEVEQLTAQVKQGDLSAVRAYLARSRVERDWQDLLYVLGWVSLHLRIEVLDFVTENEPDAADLALLRCAYYTSRAWQMRGHGTCDKVQKGGFEAAFECLTAAIAALEKFIRLDPEDPTALAYVLGGLMIFGVSIPMLQGAFARVQQLAPSLVPAHRTVTNALAQRWYGSHEKSLGFARAALRDAPAGSDMAYCLFWAHWLVESHLEYFDEKPKEAREYWQSKAVRDELGAAFDQWTAPPYAPRRSSIAYLHEVAAWFYRVRDHARLKRALELAGDTFDRGAWRGRGNAAWRFEKAVKFASGPDPVAALEADAVGEFLNFVRYATSCRKKGDWIQAGKAAVVAMGTARHAPAELQRPLLALGLLQLGLVFRAQGRADDARKALAKAMEKLDACEADEAPSGVAHELAKTLMELKEFSRAIAHWEQALQAEEDEVKPVAVAEMLRSLGQCYCSMGLVDHGAVPLRAALRIYREYPGDPRLAGCLLTLGNALRRTNPAEAEALYNEVVELRMAKLQYESATLAWVNLGILCSEQGRHPESLEHYRKVLRVREQTPGTPPARVGSVMNNLANAYRRMERFAEAQEWVDRALVLFAPEDPSLASVYGTRGLIYLDAGDDAQAAEWLRKARDEQAKQPSPNLQTRTENLEKEIAALDRLGRAAAAAAAREELERTRAAIRAVPQSEGGVQQRHFESEDAVLVELAFGWRRRTPDTRAEIDALGKRLSKLLPEGEAGRYAGWVSIPENTTLFFYGPDAEKLFAALESALTEEPLCAGARVTLQHQGNQREIGVRSHPARVN